MLECDQAGVGISQEVLVSLERMNNVSMKALGVSKRLGNCSISFGKGHNIEEVPHIIKKFVLL